MALIDYTSFDDVRAALGVSEDELEDTTLSLDLYEFGLNEDLDDISTSLRSSFATVSQKAESERSVNEIRFFESVKMFATYSVARHLTVSLPLFSPKEITDGKAAAVRYAQDPYKKVIENIEARFERGRNRVAEALAALNSTSTSSRVPRIFFAKATPATDPVTGS